MSNLLKRSIIPVEIMDESISIWLSAKGSKVKTPKNKVENGLIGSCHGKCRNAP